MTALIDELKKLEIIKLTVENARLTGEYIGTLKGILWWDIPEELRAKIQEAIKELSTKYGKDY